MTTTTVKPYTALINAATQEYPVFMQKVKEELVVVSFPIEPTPPMVEQYGYFVVEQTEQPVGDVITEGPPEEVDGVWKQTWVTRPFNEEELATRLANAKSLQNSRIDALRDAALAIGTQFDFGEPFGVQHIQVRDCDRSNITGLRVSADARINNEDETPYIFRTYENSNIPVTPVQVVAMSDAALAGYMDILGLVWGLKDETDAATTIAELPELPESLV